MKSRLQFAPQIPGFVAFRSNERDRSRPTLAEMDAASFQGSGVVSLERQIVSASAQTAVN